MSLTRVRNPCKPCGSKLRKINTIMREIFIKVYGIDHENKELEINKYPHVKANNGHGYIKEARIG
jgi:hypothetical protein